ncbi:hypothetical protein Hanom_Chr01g00012061 [Helianthus anomalus]
MEKFTQFLRLFSLRRIKIGFLFEIRWVNKERWICEEDVDEEEKQALIFLLFFFFCLFFFTFLFLTFLFLTFCLHKFRYNRRNVSEIL